MLETVTFPPNPVMVRPGGVFLCAAHITASRPAGMPRRNSWPTLTWCPGAGAGGAHRGPPAAVHLEKRIEAQPRRCCWVELPAGEGPVRGPGSAPSPGAGGRPALVLAVAELPEAPPPLPVLALLPMISRNSSISTSNPDRERGAAGPGARRAVAWRWRNCPKRSRWNTRGLRRCFQTGGDAVAELLAHVDLVPRRWCRRGTSRPTGRRPPGEAHRGAAAALLLGGAAGG